MGVVFLIVIIVIAVWVLASCVRIVPQAYAVILERLGAYQATWSTGIHFKVPFIERVARKVNLKEQVVDFPPQPVITKDNVTMQIDTVVFFQITDPKLYTYGVENPIMAIENLSATTLRNIIGDMELDETLTSRETINTKMRASLDEATDPWGIKVNRVELKNIIPPAAIQDAMEKQMKAERERREAILIAEGQKKSTNTSLVKGKFLRNVLSSAAPAAITDIVVLFLTMLFTHIFKIPAAETSTVAATLVALVGFMMLFRVCRPFDAIRRVLFIGMLLLFAVGIFFFSALFSMSPLSSESLLVLVVLTLIAFPVFYFVSLAFDRLPDAIRAKLKKAEKSEYFN